LGWNWEILEQDWAFIELSIWESRHLNILCLVVSLRGVKQYLALIQKIRAGMNTAKVANCMLRGENWVEHYHVILIAILKMLETLDTERETLTRQLCI
jgi:hypothetical protein